MTKEERKKYNKEAIQTLGWIFGWHKKYSYYIVPIGFQVHHIDEDPSNNSLDNLQILTVEEHLKIHEETRRERLVKYDKRLSKKVLCIETGIVYESMHEASRQTRIYMQNISKVCNGRRKTTGGFHWKYVDE